jgi:hypothetical protein
MSDLKIAESLKSAVFIQLIGDLRDAAKQPIKSMPAICAWFLSKQNIIDFFLTLIVKLKSA